MRGKLSTRVSCTQDSIPRAPVQEHMQAMACPMYRSLACKHTYFPHFQWLPSAREQKKLAGNAPRLRLPKTVFNCPFRVLSLSPGPPPHGTSNTLRCTCGHLWHYCCLFFGAARLNGAAQCCARQRAACVDVLCWIREPCPRPCTMLWSEQCGVASSAAWR